MIHLPLRTPFGLFGYCLFRAALAHLRQNGDPGGVVAGIRRLGEIPILTRQSVVEYAAAHYASG